MATNRNNLINSREYAFLKAYLDFELATFGNAYQSAIKAGYSKYYARIIKTHFPRWRIRRLKLAIDQNPKLGRFIELSKQNKLKWQKAPKNRMSFEQVKSELDKLLGTYE